MIFGSVCSGIEAASVAWHPLGWRAAFLSEIEPFPRAVLAHHYPNVPLHGDFTTIQAGEYEPIDLLVGGTPCQSFSIAGLRGGLADERGNLALEFLRLAERLRPRWLVWENVPGVLSSGGGRDFGSFLGGLVQLGYGFAYRVLDAQFYGLAQRRKRVFVVGHLGDWRRAWAVLSQPASLRWDSPPRREAGEGAPGGAVCGALPSGGTPNGHGTAGVNSQAVAAGHVIATGLEVRRLPGDERGDVVPDVRMVRPRAYGCGVVANPLGAKRDGGWRGDLDNDTYVAEPMTFDWQAGGSGDESFRGKSRSYITDKPGRTRALTANKTLAVALRGREGGGVAELGGDCAHAIRASQGGGDKPHVLAFVARQSDVIQYGDRSGPLDTDGHTVAVAFQTRGSNVDLGQDVTGTIGSNADRASGSAPCLAVAAAVRRLTPEECEALQGFPRLYTRIPYGKKGPGSGWSADGPRYRALGNSMAVPCMAWIGRRIAAQDAILAAEAQRKQEAA